MAACFHLGRKLAAMNYSLEDYKKIFPVLTENIDRLMEYEFYLCTILEYDFYVYNPYQALLGFIYTLKENSRVIDVIELAGGLTEEANTSVINLSKKITDEMVIIIYSNREVENFEQTKEMEKILQEKCNQPDENSLINDACINGEPRETTPGITGKISINSATKEELMTLPGIGESKAKDIITYREQNGPFTTIEDIMKVSGINKKIAENIYNYFHN